MSTYLTENKYAILYESDEDSEDESHSEKLEVAQTNQLSQCEACSLRSESVQCTAGREIEIHSTKLITIKNPLNCDQHARHLNTIKSTASIQPDILMHDEDKDGFVYINNTTTLSTIELD